jgi:hypothetical protein
VKGIGVILFFLFWTLVGAVGMVMAVHGHAWLLLLSVLVYLGMFIKWGCLGTAH